jgi:hypothetical protein
MHEKEMDDKMVDVSGKHERWLHVFSLCRHLFRSRPPRVSSILVCIHLQTAVPPSCSSSFCHQTPLWSSIATQYTPPVTSPHSILSTTRPS